MLLSFIGWLLPTRSRRPAAAAHDSRMKQATVDVKSLASMVCKEKEISCLLEITLQVTTNQTIVVVISLSHSIQIYIYSLLF